MASITSTRSSAFDESVMWGEFFFLGLSPRPGIQVRERAAELKEERARGPLILW